MKTKIVGIYLIECQDRVYVGQSNNILRRWRAHRSDLNLNRHPNKYLQNLWNKHGKSKVNFKIAQSVKIDLIEKLDKKQIKSLLTVLEQTWMNLLNNKVNSSPAAGSRLGSETSQETRKKLSLAGKGRGAKPYYLISPSGVIFEGVSISEFCKENNLPTRNLGCVVRGESFQHQGWTSSITNHKLYLDKYPNRGITKNKRGSKYRVSYCEDKVRKAQYFKDIKDAIKFRDSLEEKGYIFQVQIPNWKKKITTDTNLIF
jgi:group I intron endonuclease